MNELSPSREDYLKTIFLLSQLNHVVRVKDISQKLGVKPASVINIVKALSKNGFVIHEHYGYIELTEQGEKEALIVLRKYKILFDFFQSILGLSSEEAYENACSIEHYITDNALKAIEKINRNLKKNKKVYE